VYEVEDGERNVVCWTGVGGDTRAMEPVGLIIVLVRNVIDGVNRRRSVVIVGGGFCEGEGFIRVKVLLGCDGKGVGLV